MDPVRNPFVPGAGVQPPELAGRAEILGRADVALKRLMAGRPTKSFIAVGLRGVGKTVVLNRVREMADGLGFRVAFIEAHEQKNLPALIIPALRKALLDLDRLGALSEHVKRGLRVLRSFMSAVTVKYGDAELALDVDPERGAADSGDLEVDLPEMFASLGKAAADRQAHFVLIIDEIQYLSERDMSALIMSLHRVAQEGWPILMIAAGLPQIVGLTGRSKSYAERLFDFPRIDALDDDDAYRALMEPARREGVQFEFEVIKELIATTQGYPFFLQECAYHAWNTAPSSPISRDSLTLSLPLAIRRLDESFFRVRFDRLTPREKDYLRAMADLGPGPHRSGDVADRLALDVRAVGPLRSSLIRKGMVFSPAHGDTAFTVPLFDGFLRRIMPDWQPRPTASRKD